MQHSNMHYIICNNKAPTLLMTTMTIHIIPTCAHCKRYVYIQQKYVQQTEEIPLV